MLENNCLISKTGFVMLGEKGRESDSVPWQSPTPTDKSKNQRDKTKPPPKYSITKRLRTDLGRSVGETNTT